jgi:hypothetical protein
MDEYWEALSEAQQLPYIEWVCTLVELEKMPDEGDEELMQKAIRMHKCDVHQGEFWEL